MRVTKTLFLRELLSKLHPPSPATSRESQQLLRLLDTSFRHRLDDLHPGPRANEQHTSREQVPLANSQGTDSHLYSVLHHPLLAANVDCPQGDRRLRPSLIFEIAVRESRVSSQLLYTCCRHYMDNDTPFEAVPSDRLLGPRIASWLSSTTAGIRRDTLTNTKIIPVLLPVMYADGLEDVVWTWLSAVYKRPWDLTEAVNPPLISHFTVEDTFVSAMMRESIRRGAFEDAVQQFVKASEYRATLGRARITHDATMDVHEYRPLLKSWKRISTVILSRRSTHGISSPAFKSLLQCSVPLSSQSLISKGTLLLYHPEKPSSETLFRELQVEGLRHSWTIGCQNASAPLRGALLLANLDAAELALSQHRPQESRFFLDLAQEQWPNLFKTITSPEPAERLEQARDEAAIQLPFTDSLVLT
jgi:hypothetical protein